MHPLRQSQALTAETAGCLGTTFPRQHRVSAGYRPDTSTPTMEAKLVAVGADSPCVGGHWRPSCQGTKTMRSSVSTLHVSAI
jgi:hypothetical protein